jgi:fatty acid-binding protein DegV
MSYKIFGDSCLDLTEELKKDPRFEMIPLTLQVDDHMVIDDETFDQKAFIAMVKASPNCPKTACPSPEAFKKACECDADS